MRWWCWVILGLGLVAGVAIAADRGAIHTRDGRGYEGRLVLADGDMLVITPLGAEPVPIPLNDLRDATFRSLPAPEPDSRKTDESPGDRTPRQAASPVNSLVLRDGSELVGVIHSIDAKGVTLIRGGETRLLPPQLIARIVFDRPLPDGADKPAEGQTGALLDTGDFFEAEFRSFDGSKATFSSVLFGNRTFTAGKDLRAIIFATPRPTAAKFILKMADGSMVRAVVLHLNASGVKVEDGVGEKWSIPAEEVAQIQRVEASK